jgi:hypothetical protein
MPRASARPTAWARATPRPVKDGHQLVCSVQHPGVPPVHHAHDLAGVSAPRLSEHGNVGREGEQSRVLQPVRPVPQLLLAAEWDGRRKRDAHLRADLRGPRVHPARHPDDRGRGSQLEQLGAQLLPHRRDLLGGRELFRSVPRERHDLSGTHQGPPGRSARRRPRSGTAGSWTRTGPRAAVRARGRRGSPRASRTPPPHPPTGGGCSASGTDPHRGSPRRGSARPAGHCGHRRPATRTPHSAPSGGPSAPSPPRGRRRGAHTWPARTRRARPPRPATYRSGLAATPWPPKISERRVGLTPRRSARAPRP